MEQQPLAACRALDMALRGLPELQNEGHSGVGMQVADTYCLMIMVHVWAGVVSAKPDIWRGTEAGQMQPAMFSLSISVLKLAACLKCTIDGEGSAEAEMVLFSKRFAAVAARLCKLQQAAAAQPVDAAPTSSSSSSSSNSSSIISSGNGGSSSSSTSPSPGVLCLLLQARFVRLIGKHFAAAGQEYAEGLQQASAEGDVAQSANILWNLTFVRWKVGDHEVEAVAVLAAFCAEVLTLIESLLLAVQLPGAAGSEAACAAAKQQLQQQLQQQVGEVPSSIAVMLRVLEAAKEVGQLDAPGTDSQLLMDLKCVVEALPLLGQQLVLFAEAVCAELPVPLCCNNHNCKKLLGASEQRLLTVKSVCPRCR
jgi:hypothetical protein